MVIGDLFAAFSTDAYSSAHCMFFFCDLFAAFSCSSTHCMLCFSLFQKKKSLLHAVLIFPVFVFSSFCEG